MCADPIESNSVNVTVRRATTEDAAGVARVHVASWRGAYRGLLPDEVLDRLSVERRAEQWREWLRPTGERPLTLVAEAGSIVGFASLAIPSYDDEEADGVGEIPALYVEPAAWGIGAGSALMDAGVAELRAAGCGEAILWMLEGNERARRFYEHKGWRTDGGRREARRWPGVSYEELEEEL